MQLEPDWIPLKEALYGSGGLFPTLRRRDVFELVAPIERTSCATGLRHYFLTPEQLLELRALSAARI